jgi:hypothetical protein
MKKEEFEFVRLVGNERRVGTTLASVSRHWQGKKERFLVVRFSHLLCGEKPIGNRFN